jgi:hypothetical protein
MNQITLETINSASMVELQAFANDNKITIIGDKRQKTTWIESITRFLEVVETSQEVVETMVVEPTPETSQEIVEPTPETSQEIVVEPTPETCQTSAEPTPETCQLAEPIKFTEIPETDIEPSPSVRPEEIPETDIEPSPSARPGEISERDSEPFNLTPLMMIICVLWFCLGLVKVGIYGVRKTIPILDVGLTWSLESLMNAIDYCFGDDDSTNAQLI